MDNIEKRKQVIDFALEQLGKDYIHNTYGPDTFDCAGFAWYVYKNVLDINIFEDGIGLSTTTKTMTSKYGKMVLFSEKELEKDIYLIKPGDILFFHSQALKDDKPKEDNKYPGHVGIYLGNNKFIHATKKVGNVVIDDFNCNKRLYKKLVGYKDIIN